MSASRDPPGTRRHLRAAPAAAMACVMALLVLTVALVALGFANWPAADDYCNGVLATRLGIPGALAWLYTQWSGRVVTGLVLYATDAVLPPTELRWVSMAVAATMPVMAWQLATFAVGVTPVRTIVAGATLAMLAVGLYGLLGQTVYWPTGGIVYWLPVLLLLHWLNGLRALLAAPERAHARRLYWFVIGMLLGDAIELVVPIALAYAGAMLWRHRDEVAMRRALLVRIGGVMAGAAVLVSAPGNYQRAHATPDSFNVDPALLARAYVDILWQGLEAGAPLLAMVAILAMIAIALRRAHRDAVHEMRRRGTEAVALAIGGLLSVTPVLAAPAQAAPRNALYLLVSVLAAALVITLPVLRRTRAGVALLAVIAVVGSIAVTVRLADDAHVAWARRDDQLARHALLSAPSRAGTDVAVAPLRSPAPRTEHAVDITTDPGALVNWCVATYYGLRSIRIDPTSVTR